ncbi:MAG: hypothetical protein ACRC20_11285 [Segniliparus sp.]|uniref:hypothetical protein n=1 Tax=Segniliparus sp. TaxID=2804064 RepID=UPI003F3B4A8F
MKITAIALPLACAGMFGFAAYAQAQTPAELGGTHFSKSIMLQDDDDDVTVDEDATDDEAPTRPGGKTHFSRNSLNEDDEDSADDSPADQAPTRPGGKTHYSRNGVELDNSGHPVTGQGPNKGTEPLNDTLDAAGGQHHR